LKTGKNNSEKQDIFVKNIIFCTLRHNYPRLSMKTILFILSFTSKYLDVKERIKREIKNIEAKMMELIQFSDSLSENYKLVTSIKGIAMINTVAILVATQNFIQSVPDFQSTRNKGRTAHKSVPRLPM
jgi:hypothetical protein